MVQIQILCNGKLVRKFNCPKTMMQKYLNVAIDVAGGMYNGKDNFKVKTIKLY